jgi:glycosyltransferase involved in cell wall biosynthesis
MKLSVIVCTHDRRRLDDLDDCIQSLLNQNYDDFEIIIVVDHNEELFRVVSAKHVDVSNIKVLLNNACKGLSASLNIGISQSKGKIVCSIDDDAKADEDWLKQLVGV